jgi:hypothetical protein
MLIAFEVAGLPVAHVASEVSTQVTTSPLTGAYEYVGLFVPAFTPFTFHWYAGVVPPLTGVAVNVTLVPAQTGLAEAAIETLTGRFGFTVMVTAFEVAGLPVGHIAFEVSTQVIISPLAGA